MSYGDLQSGGLAASELDVFSFSGTSGDEVLVRLAETSSLLEPKFRVFAPDNSEVCTLTAGAFAELQCSLTQTGTHHVFVEDGGGLDSGNYNLHLQRINGPANATPIAVGGSDSGNIGAAAAMNAYSFTGVLNDSITFRVTGTSGTLDPKFRVYTPSNSLLCQDADTAVAEFTCSIGANGTHHIFVEDNGATDTGNYTLELIDVTPTPLTFFVNDQVGFNAAVAGLVFQGREDWESSTLAASSVIAIDDSIAPGVSSSPAPPTFVTGTNASIGLTVQSNTNGNPGNTSPRGAGSLAAASPGYLGTPTHQVSTGFQFDSFDLIFGGNRAVGFVPLFIDSVNAIPTTGSITVQVFDTTNTLIGTQIITGVDYQGASSFLGVVVPSGTSIGRINLFDSDAVDHFQGADDIDVYN